MNTITEILFAMAPNVHFISFGLLILAGFNMPVSEDLVFIVSASIAATIVPENTVYIFIGCFMGAYFSDIIAYTIGRTFGRRLLKISFFQKLFPEEKIEKIERYFLKYGGNTLFFGRFIPFGMRNVLFATSGIVKMKISKFLLVDFLALCVTSTVLFYLGYNLGQNYQVIFPYLNRYKFIILALLSAVVCFFLFRNWIRKKQNYT
jgi:membrane protein DedA with SNARE-associated domain